jgi:hypothetical protein
MTRFRASVKRRSQLAAGWDLAALPPKDAQARATGPSVDGSMDHGPTAARSLPNSGSRQASFWADATIPTMAPNLA